MSDLNKYEIYGSANTMIQFFDSVVFSVFVSAFRNQPRAGGRDIVKK